jgi:hypothetical protein
MAAGCMLGLSASACAAQEPTQSELGVALQAGFSVQAARTLRDRGTDLRRLDAAETEAPRQVPPAISVAVSEDEANEIVRALRNELGRGYVVFHSEANFNRGPDRIAVLHGADQYDALRFMQTNGINYEIDTDSVVALLKRWDREHGLRLLGAGMDWVEMEIVNPPADMAVLAAEVYAVCPDVVSQGTETVERLADERRRPRVLYLWWDSNDRRSPIGLRRSAFIRRSRPGRVRRIRSARGPSPSARASTAPPGRGC